MNLFAIVAAPVIADGLTTVLIACARSWSGAGERSPRHKNGRQLARATSAHRRGDDRPGARGTTATAPVARRPQSHAGRRRAHRGEPGEICARVQRGLARRRIDLSPLATPPRLRRRPDPWSTAKRSLEHDDFEVLFGRVGWQGVLDRWDVTSAILPVEAPCAQLFAASQSWRAEYTDERNVIFVRTR